MPCAAVLCSSLISCFRNMLLRNFLSDSRMVQAASVVTNITFVFTFHMSCISVARSLYYRIFSACLLITFQSREIVVSNGIYVVCACSNITVGDVWCTDRQVRSVALVDCIIYLPYFRDLFLLILVNVHISVRCLISPLFPSIL